MRRFASALVVALVALGLSACASRAARQAGTPVERGSTDVSAPGGADRLAAAALSTWATSGNTAEALTLISRAAALEADRPELTWLQIRLCVVSKDCEPAAAEARLRKLDPGNGVVWLGVLSRAQAQRDKRAEASILDAMSRAERFDLYWTTLVWRLTNIVAADRKPANMPAATAGATNPQQYTPLTTALNDVTGWLSRLATPAFSAVGAACDRALARASPPACSRIAEAMQRSDTTLVEGLGLGIAQRLATPGSPAAAALDRRVVTLSYRNQAAGAVIQGQIERDKFSAELLELMKKLHREQDVSLAILRWAQEPLTPTG